MEWRNSGVLWGLFSYWAERFPALIPMFLDMPNDMIYNVIWHRLSQGVPMDHVQQLTKVLGGARALGSPRSDFDFIAIIRRGLGAKSIAAVVQASDLSEELLCKSLRIPVRTAARRKATAARWKPVESELIFRFAKVLVHANQVLGDKAKSRAWLLTENRALRGARPIELLDTSIGYQDVLDVLRRIEHGVYS
jgi:putative toxin-antitoxin system antitoxin component (TIGR02293 family)